MLPQDPLLFCPRVVSNLSHLVKHGEAPRGKRVQGLREAAQVWRFAVQVQAAQEGRARQDGYHYQEAIPEFILS